MKKTFKDTWKYFFDKGPQLMLLSILPALLTPFLLSPSTSLRYLLEFERLNSSSFSAMYLEMRALPYEFFYLGILGIILYIFVTSLMFGIVDRHMRVGEFTISFRRAKTRLNYNLLTAIKFIFTIAVCFELINLLTTTLYYVLALMTDSSVLWLVLGSIVCLAGMVAVAFIASAIMLWAPFMLHTGLRTGDAFKMGWRNMSGRITKTALILLSAAAPFIIAITISTALNGGAIVNMILEGLAFAVIMPFYIILMYHVFYEVTGTERMDLHKVDIWKKGRRK